MAVKSIVILFWLIECIHSIFSAAIFTRYSSCGYVSYDIGYSTMFIVWIWLVSIQYVSYIGGLYMCVSGASFVSVLTQKSCGYFRATFFYKKQSAWMNTFCVLMYLKLKQGVVTRLCSRFGIRLKDIALLKMVLYLHIYTHHDAICSFADINHFIRKLIYIKTQGRFPWLNYC